MVEGSWRRHVVLSTAVGLVAVFATTGFIAFARRTAEISTEFGPLTYSSVAVSVLLTSYIAYSVLQLLKEYTEKPYELFMYIAGFLFIMSYMPIGHVALDMENAGMAEINVLGAIHAIAATFIIAGLAKIELIRNR